MAEPVQQKCSNCKKMGMVRCDGCTQRFCSSHFTEHRHHLDNLFEQVCNDRDSLCEQINNPRSVSSSTDPPLITLLNEINDWESKTLKMVKQTADYVRQQITELMNSNNKSSEVELDKLSKELRQRKEEDDYFEQDIERLNKQLQKLQVGLNTQRSPSIRVNITSIDWSRVIQVVTKKSKPSIIRQQQNQFFVGGTFLTKDHQIQLNRFYGSENQKWQLIYKAMKHGFDPEIYHQCCNKQGPTLTVIQSTEGYLFGGYTSVDWNSRGNWMNDKAAFLFTLINPHNISPTKYSINETGEGAICSGCRSGPTFGCYDFFIRLDPNRNAESFSEFPTSYIDSTGKGNLTFTGSQNFIIIDIEMYRLVFD